MKDDLLEKLKGLDIVYNGVYKLKHVEEQYKYVDIKKAYGYPPILSSICDEIFGLISNSSKVATAIAASGYGGIPLASGIALKYDLNLTMIRSHPKHYGKIGLIDGHVPVKEDKVVIVDDVFTTGKSITEIADVIKPTGATILGCYVVVKRFHQKTDIPVYNLFTLEDLMS